MSLVLVGRWPFLLLNREQACLFAPIMQAVGHSLHYRCEQANQLNIDYLHTNLQPCGCGGDVALADLSKGWEIVWPHTHTPTTTQQHHPLTTATTHDHHPPPTSNLVDVVGRCPRDGKLFGLTPHTHHHPTAPPTQHRHHSRPPPTTHHPPPTWWMWWGGGPS